MVLRSLHLRRIVDQTNGFNLWMILMKMIATRNLATCELLKSRIHK